MKSLHQLELVPNSNAVVPVAELDKSLSLEPVRRSIPVPSYFNPFSFVRGIDRVFRKVLKSIRSALTKNVAA